MPEPAIQALLLDIGNVCVRLRTQAFLDRVTPLGRPGLSQAELLASLRDPASPHDAYERGRLDGPGFHGAMVERLGLRLGYADWLRAWNAYFEPNRPMEALLARLQGRLRLWALSNTNAEHLAHVRLNFRLFDAFEGFSASHEVGARKPEAAIFEHALRGLGLPPGQVLYLDDVAAFIEVGRGHGLQGFHYTFNDAELRAELGRLGLDLPPLGGRSLLAC
jgi:glucose-1-phosphatase